MSAFSFNRGIPSFWTIQLAGWIVYLAAIYVTFLTIAPLDRFLYLFYLKLFRAFTGFLLTSAVLRPFYKRFDGRLQIAGLVALVLISATLLGCVWTAIEATFVYLTTFPFDLGTYLARSPRIALDYAMTLTAWSALYLGAKNWLAWREERENAMRSAVLAKQAEVEMLRYQINPHFLFNALNSIRASVDEDAERAKEMITRMSEFLRYSLLAESRLTIPLSEEIDAVRNYLAIEKVRFEDGLAVEFDIDESAAEFQVPSFVLTPLVDNAVKHGRRTTQGTLRIDVAARASGAQLRLEVRNTGRLDKSDGGDGGTGIGLKNVEERLRRLFGDGAGFEIEQDEGLVKARIWISDETHRGNS